MKRKMLSMVMALATILSLLPATALAADVDSAEALQNALNAGGEVKLTESVSGDFVVPAGISVTLDLNGKTITNGSGHTITVKHGASLTVTGTGTVDNVTHAKAAIWNEGTVILDGGNYTRSQETGTSAEVSGDNSYYVLVNHGTMTVNDGVSVTQNGQFSSLFENGYYSYGSGNADSGYVDGINAQYPQLTINGGTFTGGLNTIKNDDGGMLTINNGTFSNTSQSAFLNWNVATVNGGTFSSNENCVLNGGGDPAVDQGKLTINGGSFTSKQDAIAAMNNNAGYLDGVTVTGGRFSSDVSNYVADGYQIVQQGDQWVVGTLDDVAVAQIVGGEKYQTLSEAIAAAKDGDTVKLLGNAIVKERIIISSKNFTLDTNGYSVVYTGTASNKEAVIDFYGTSQVTITGNGAFTIDDNYFEHNAIGYTFRVNDTAKLTIENGTYYAGLTCVQVGDSAVAYIHGGSFRASGGWNDTYWLLNLIDDSDAQIIVSGGTFENFDPANSKTENPVANFCAQGYAAAKSMKDDVALYTVVPAAAEVNGKYYATLSKAVEAVVTSESKTGTVKLLRDATGGGIGLFNGKGATDVNLTIDFGGFTYTCADPAVGSAGTESQGFHLEKGNTVTLKNGTIRVAEDSTKTIMLIQNYCDLTLENLDLYGSDATQYIISSNYGDMVLNHVSINGTHSQLVAVDLMHWLGTNYADKAPTMVIRNDTGDAIVGKMDVYCYGSGADSCAEKPQLNIYGGYFTSDPSAYVADGYAALPSDNSAYVYMVGAAAETDVEAAVGAPDVTVGDQIKAEDRETVKDAAESVTTSGELAAAANQAIGQVTEQQKVDAEAALKNSSVETEGKTITIYAQTYLDITPTAYDKDKGVLTLDITPMYRVVASTANNAAAIKLEGSDKNAVVLEGSEKELTGIKTMTISITLPNNFITDGTSNVFVKHTKDGKLVGYHTAAVNSSVLTFTNNKGFSTFEIKTDERSAQVQFGADATATTLTPADVNSALPKAAAPAGQVFSGWTFEGIEGTYSTLTDELLTALSDAYENTPITATAQFYTPSSGTSYAITVDKADNGTVTSSRTRANKGLTVTLTVKADEGYKLDTITVTDKNGNEIKLTDKGDGKYTFTMPASAVTVKASFAKDDTPVETGLPFTDVKADDWFYEAVKYAYDNKLMDGTSSTTFAPLMTTNRAMIVTILWRLAGSPVVNYAMNFSDVESGVWYTEAVRWAAAEGIVKGYSDTVFAPDDTVTREQLATILYRYAEYKEYDVSAKGDLTTFADGSTVSTWAADGMTWAVGAQLITGKDGGKLDPTGTATRAEVATILMRFCENVAK